jgi:hypothetical protein
VAAVNSASAAIMALLIQALASSTRLKPQRRRMGAAVSFIVTAPTAALKVSRPDWKALMPKPSCSISGSRKGRAPTARRNRLPPMIEMRRLALCSSVRSMMGCGVRRACRTYSHSSAAPPAIIASAGPGWVDRLPSSVKPKIASDSPLPVSAKPRQSSGGVSAARTCGTNHSARMPGPAGPPARSARRCRASAGRW